MQRKQEEGKERQGGEIGMRSSFVNTCGYSALAERAVNPKDITIEPFSTYTTRPYDKIDMLEHDYVLSSRTESDNAFHRT